MRLTIFPLAVGAIVLTSWVALMMIEQCFLLSADPKFGCWNAAPIAIIFAVIGALLAAAAAALARVLFCRLLPPQSPGRECLAALFTSVLLVLAFYAIVEWDLDIGGPAGPLLGWLACSFVICGASLLVLRRLFKV